MRQGSAQLELIAIRRGEQPMNVQTWRSGNSREENQPGRTAWRPLVNIIFAVLVVFPSSRAHAGDPVVARGFDPNGVYHLGDVDSINLMTGELTARIPLGLEYKSSGSLHYAFGLTYNSNLWDYQAQSAIGFTGLCCIDITESFTYEAYQMLFGNDNSPPPPLSEIESYPHQQFNAGLGWSLSMGDMRNGVDYISEDGAEHRFGTTLQQPSSTNGPDPLVTTCNQSPLSTYSCDFTIDPSKPALYTSDGSYLRLVDRGSPSFDPNPYGDEREIQFPDGLIKKFYCDSSQGLHDAFPLLSIDKSTGPAGPCSNAAIQRWLLDEIADPYGNALYVQRTDVTTGQRSDFRPPVGDIWRWTFVEATTGQNGYFDWRSGASAPIVRTHYIDFLVVNAREIRASQIVLAAPQVQGCGQGGAPACGQMTYVFNYVAPPAGSGSTSIFRDYGTVLFNVDPGALMVPYNSIHKVDVSLLQSVSLPAGAGGWQFGYTDDSALGFAAGFGPGNTGAPPGTPADIAPWYFPVGTSPAASPSDCTTQPHVYCDSHRSGRLTQITLPTGGGIRYNYDVRRFPTGYIYRKNGDLAPGPHTSVGVAVRQVLDINGQADGNPWLYFGDTSYLDYTLHPAPFNGQSSPPLAPSVLGTVIDPEGIATVTAFSTRVQQFDPLPTIAHSWDYGLPIATVMPEAQYLTPPSLPSDGTITAWPNTLTVPPGGVGYSDISLLCEGCSQTNISASSPRSDVQVALDPNGIEGSFWSTLTVAVASTVPDGTACTITAPCPLTVAVDGHSVTVNLVVTTAPARYWSSEVYQCAESSFDFSPTALVNLYASSNYSVVSNIPNINVMWGTANATPSCNKPFRTMFRSYENSSAGCGGPGVDWYVGNPRLNSEKTVYYGVTYTTSPPVSNAPTQDSWAEIDYSDFDGLGHYRTSKTDGNFFEQNFPNSTHPPGNQKTITTVFNPNVLYSNETGAFGVASGGTDSNFAPHFPTCANPLLTCEPWLINLYDTKSAMEPQANGTVASAWEDFTFDSGFPNLPGTGFLTSHRMLMDPNGGLTDHDVRMVMTRTPVAGTSSVMVSTQYFGGDVGTQSAATYELDDAYVAGALQSRTYKSLCDSGALTTETNKIDPSSGLVTTSTDMSGATTMYQYDALGRLTQIAPPGLAATTYIYTPVGIPNPNLKLPGIGGSTSSKAWANVFAQRKDGSGTYEESSYWFDHMGRLASEQHNVPSGWNEMDHEFLPNGWKMADSTTGQAGIPPASWTTYDSYDPFGSPLEMKHPDGNMTTFQYQGVRETYEKTWGLDLATGNSTFVDKLFDRQGRLVRVSDFSASPASTIPTDYEYDVLDHLVKVTTDVGGEPKPQTRTWSYDNRGFMTGETGPELITDPVTKAAVTINFGDFDARGHAGSRTLTGIWNGNALANPSPFDLNFQFDFAERPVSVSQPQANSKPDLPLKTFGYYQAGDSPLTQGKLKTATRVNYLTLGNYTVTENYAYDPMNGLLASKEVTNSPAGLDATVAYHYRLATGGSMLGDGSVVKIDYPTQAPGAIGPVRTVRDDYTLGHLTAVDRVDANESLISQYASGISYHLNGVVNQISYPDGHKDTISIEPDNIARPSTIELIANDKDWVQSYTYDGAGRISNIGGIAGGTTTAFAYDPVGRLVSSSKTGEGGGPEIFTYDRYGNHTDYNLLTDSGTNRFTGPGTCDDAGIGPCYDAAGNVTRLPDLRPNSTQPLKFTYDPLNLMTSSSGDTISRYFIYDPSDQRVGVIDSTTTPPHETWSIRDAGNQVLRDFDHTSNVWSWKEDYVYRKGSLLATITPSGSNPETVHTMHLDHLGTPRVVTAADGSLVDTRNYSSFGSEIAKHANAERMDFTGHERDYNGSIGRDYGDVDYMHARYYFTSSGKFLSADSVEGRASDPQSWNRYTYARNNPISLADPTGNDPPNGAQGGSSAGLTSQQSFQDNLTDWYYRTIPPEVIATLSTLVTPAFDHPFANPAQSPGTFATDALAFGSIFLPGGGDAVEKGSMTFMADAAGNTPKALLPAAQPLTRAASQVGNALMRSGKTAVVVGEGMGRVNATAGAMGGAGTTITSFLRGAQWNEAVQAYFNSLPKGVVVIIGRDGRAIPSRYYSGELRSLGGDKVIDLSHLSGH